MAADEVSICNLAISNCESDKFIESLDETSTEAMNCKVWYADTRDLVLRRADWPFARKRQQIIQTTDDPPAEWGFRYGLPSDCISVRGVEDGQRVRTFDQAVKYAIENDGTGSGRVLLMDVAAAVLVYTMQAKDPVIYPPEFVECLSWKLAANIARALKVGAEARREILQIAEAMIGRAAAISYNELKSDGPPPSEHFTARLG